MEVVAGKYKEQSQSGVEMEQEATSSGNGSSDVLIQASSAVGTLLAMSALRFGLFFFFLHMSRRLRSRQVALHVEEQAAGDQSSCHGATGDARRRWHVLSEVPGDLIFYPASAIFGIYFIQARLLQLPLTTFDPWCKWVYPVCIGHLAYKTLSLITMPLKARQKADTLHYFFGIGVYVVILYTKEDAILGAVGMVSTTSVFFLCIRRATQDVDKMALVHKLASVTWILTSFLFMFLLPAYWLIFSVVKHSVSDMTLLSVGTFCFAAVYFGVAFLAHVVRACMKVCSPENDVTVVVRLSESSELIGSRSQVSRYLSLDGRHSTPSVIVVAPPAGDLGHLNNGTDLQKTNSEH